MAAYFIFNHNVLDAETLNDDYLPKAVETLKPYDPEILVVDQNVELVEGRTEDNRMVVLKFESREEARTWYDSPEYQAIIDLRLNSVDGRAVLCDAFDPSSV